MISAVLRPFHNQAYLHRGPFSEFQAKDHVLFVPPVSEEVAFRDPCSVCAYPLQRLHLAILKFTIL